MKAPRKSRAFYGFYIVAACFFVLFGSSPPQSSQEITVIIGHFLSQVSWCFTIKNRIDKGFMSKFQAS